jgi:hypothetical protein
VFLRRQLALAKQFQLAPAISQGCLARVLTDVMHFLDVQHQAMLPQFGASHGIGGQQGRLPSHLAHQGGTFAFDKTQPGQFRIDASTFKAAASPALAVSCRPAIKRAHQQQQAAEQTQFQRPGFSRA